MRAPQNPLTPEQLARYQAWSEKRETQSELENIREDLAKAVALLSSAEELLRAVPETDPGRYSRLGQVVTVVSHAGVELRLATSAMDRLTAAIGRVEQHLKGEG